MLLGHPLEDLLIAGSSDSFLTGVWQPIPKIGNRVERWLLYTHVHDNSTSPIRTGGEVLTCCKHVRAVVPILLGFLACVNPILEIDKLDMPTLVRADHRLSRFHITAPC